MVNENTQSIVTAENLRIEGVPFACGTVVGEMREGQIVATAEGVTRGHLEPRLRDGRCVVGSPADVLPQAAQAEPGAIAPPALGEQGGESPAYEALTKAQLIDEVNRRREAGRNVACVPSANKATIIDALQRDDEQQSLEAEANQDDNDDA